MPQEETDSTGESVSELVDATGTPWRLAVEFDRSAGRVEVARMELQRQGAGRLTSTLLRAAERTVLTDLEWRRAAQETEGLTEEELLGDGTDGGPPDERQPPPMPHGRIGPRRNDELWRRRAVAMASAWRKGRPLVQALRDLEPGASDATYKVRVKRTREWDAETGAGLLDGVGRARGER